MELDEISTFLKKERGPSTIREFAREIGISTATLSRLENGHLPSFSTLAKISEYTDKYVGRDSVTDIVKQLLIAIEGNPLRKDLKETPGRVARALDEMLDGYRTDVNEIFKTFDGEGTDQIVAERNIPFVSMCEHHLLVFTGVAHVAYLPGKTAIGASKLARLVCAFAHRLQIQERITEQVGHTLMDKLKPRGVAVILQATHSCMTCRGIKAVGTEMITSLMLGAFRENQATRMEVLSLLGLTK